MVKLFELMKVFLKPLLAAALVFLCLSRGFSSVLQVGQPNRSAIVYSDSVMQYVVLDTPYLALTGATLIDGTGTGAMEAQTVLLEHGVITAVGPVEDVPIPKHFQRLQLPGKTIIPGLVGTHNHLRLPRSAMLYTGPRLYLAKGVTTIQTCGTGHVHEELKLARAINAGGTVGPDIVNSGPYFTGPEGKSNFIRCTDSLMIRDTIRQLARQGVRWLKVYRNTRPAELALIVKAAHQYGLKVTGHLCATTYEEAAALGIDAIEHGFIHSFDHAEGKLPGRCGGSHDFRSELDLKGDQVRSVQQTLIREGVALSTTPAILEAQTPGLATVSPEELRLFTPELQQAYWHRQQRMKALGDDWYFGPNWLERSLAYDLQFFRAGGLLTAGPDPGLHILPGFGDQRNYRLLVAAGFQPWEAIQVMTSNGAKLLERTDIGSITPGKRANLVVLDGDLRESHQAIEKIIYVFKDGKGYDPERLLTPLKGLVGSDFDNQYRYE